MSFAGFFAALWLINLSFAMSGFSDLMAAAGDGGSGWTGMWQTGWMRASFLINGAGSIAYITVAPTFYHEALGLPMNRLFRVCYRLVYVVMLVFVGLLFIDQFRQTAMVVLNLLLFSVVLYGILLIALGYRRITERSLRRAVVTFIIMAAVFFPLMFIEAWPVPEGSSGLVGRLNHFALPSFYALLSILAVPFILKRLGRPPFWADGGPTTHFILDYGLSEREGEVLSRLCTGLSNREIADLLFISPKTVENHLSNIFSKTGVSSRLQLLTLLLSNR